MSLNKIAKECFEIDREKGFSLHQDIKDVEKHKWYLVAGIAGIHSEVSEMYEALRKNNLEHIAKEGVDVLIRTLEVLYSLKGVDIDKLVKNKIEINKKRSYMHGGKIL